MSCITCLDAEIVIENKKRVTKIYRKCNDSQIKDTLNRLKVPFRIVKLKQKCVNQGYKPGVMNIHIKNCRKNEQETTFQRKAQYQLKRNKSSPNINI